MRAIVTGGASGIGLATAQRLEQDRAEVVVLDLTAGQHPGVVVDLADLDATRRAMDQALNLLGGVDVLVNCAGVMTAGRLGELDLAEYDRIQAVNLRAPIALMNTVAPLMSANGFGRIVNVSSVHADRAEPGCLSYAVSKAGLLAATRVAGVELAGRGVLVNAVVPGFVRTPMAQTGGVSALDSPDFRGAYLTGGRLPAGRVAEPAEVAEVIAWLTSRNNSYVAGQAIVVDGGLTLTL